MSKVIAAAALVLLLSLSACSAPAAPDSGSDAESTPSSAPTEDETTTEVTDLPAEWPAAVPVPAGEIVDAPGNASKCFEADGKTVCTISVLADEAAIAVYRDQVLAAGFTESGEFFTGPDGVQLRFYANGEYLSIQTQE